MNPSGGSAEFRSQNSIERVDRLPRPHLVDVENLPQVIAEVLDDVIDGLKR